MYTFLVHFDYITSFSLCKGVFKIFFKKFFRIIFVGFDIDFNGRFILGSYLEKSYFKSNVLGINQA